MGSAAGAMKTAANRVGVTVAEYEARLMAGEKWCTGCKVWHPRAQFQRDKSRTDGLKAACAIPVTAIRATSGPGQRERRRRAAAGQAWCSDCSAWLAIGEVVQGRCRDHRNEAARAWYSTSPAVPALLVRKRERAQAVGPIPQWWREERMEQFGGLCAYGCGKRAETLDHVLTVSHGGESRPSNIVPACKSCNSSKKDAEPWEWIDRGLAAFPDLWEALIALDIEGPGYFELAEAA